MTVTLNPLDKNAVLTLDPTQLQVTADSSATFGIVRATLSFAAAKLYYEWNFSAGGGNNEVGYATAAEALAGFLGQDVNSTGYSFGGGNTTWQPPAGNGVILALIRKSFLWYGFAFDFTAQLAWVTDDAGVTWNRGLAGTQNPATGQGGLSFAGLAAGNVFPAGSLATLAGATYNFGRQPANAGGPPVGFVWIDPPAGNAVPTVKTIEQNISAGATGTTILVANQQWVLNNISISFSNYQATTAALAQTDVQLLDGATVITTVRVTAPASTVIPNVQMMNLSNLQYKAQNGNLQLKVTTVNGVPGGSFALNLGYTDWST